MTPTNPPGTAPPRSESRPPGWPSASSGTPADPPEPTDDEVRAAVAEQSLFAQIAALTGSYDTDVNRAVSDALAGLGTVRRTAELDVPATDLVTALLAGVGSARDASIGVLLGRPAPDVFYRRLVTVAALALHAAQKALVEARAPQAAPQAPGR